MNVAVFRNIPSGIVAGSLELVREQQGHLLEFLGQRGVQHLRELDKVVTASLGERLHRGEVFFQLGVSNVRAARLGGAVLAQYFFPPCL